MAAPLPSAVGARAGRGVAVTPRITRFAVAGAPVHHERLPLGEMLPGPEVTSMTPNNDVHPESIIPSADVRESIEIRGLGAAFPGVAEGRPLRPSMPTSSACVASMVAPGLPRWVDSASVDSQAMLSAFLGFLGNCTDDEATELAELFSIEHAIQPTITVLGQVLRPEPVPSPVPAHPCVASGCARCASGRGGYQFRWYSPRWGEAYRRTRRPGSWEPGQPE